MVGLLIAVILAAGYAFSWVGISIAEKFCKDRDKSTVIGIIIGIGVLLFVVGIIYAGCSDVLRVAF